MRRLLLVVAMALSLLGALFLLDGSTRTAVVANTAALITPTEACGSDCADANCPGSGSLCCRQVKSYLLGLIKITQETYEDVDRE